MFTNWLAAAAAPPPPLPPPLPTSLSSNNNNNTLPPDILLEIGPPPYVRYAAHSSLLSAHSGYLRSAITRSSSAETLGIDRTNNNNNNNNTVATSTTANTTNTNDHQLPIYLPNITTEQFTPLLTYMYTGFLDLNIENIFAVLLATHVLHMPRASEICRTFLARTQSEGYLGGAFLAAAAAAAVVPSPSATNLQQQQHQSHHQHLQQQHHQHHHQNQHSSNEIINDKKGIVRIIRPIASKASISSGLGFIAPPIPSILLPSHDTPFKSLFNNTGTILTQKNQIEIDSTQLNSFNLSSTVEESVIQSQSPSPSPLSPTKPTSPQPTVSSPKLATLSLPPQQQSDMPSTSKLIPSASPAEIITTLNKNSTTKLSSSRNGKRARSSSSHNHNNHHHHRQQQHTRHHSQNHDDIKNLSSKKSSPSNICDIVEDSITTTNSINITTTTPPAANIANTNTTRLDNNNSNNKIIIDFASCDGPVRFRRVLNESYGRGGGGSGGIGGMGGNHHPSGDDNKIIQRSHLNVATSFHAQMAKTINEQRLLQQKQRPQLSDNESENSQEIINVLSPSTTSNTTVINTNNNNNTNSTNNVNKPTTEEVYSCVYCKHTFKSQYCYQKHAKRHINPLALVSGSVHSGNGSADDNNSDMIVETIDSGSEKDDKSGDDGHQSSAVYGSTNIITSGNISCGSVSGGVGGTGSGAGGISTSGANSIYTTATNIRREVRPLDMNVQYYPCKTCGSKFPSYYFVHKHRKLCHANEEN